jgi:hypothetical protein
VSRHFATPEECALAGFTPAAQARVTAKHQVGDYAGMYVVTANKTGQGDIVVGATRDDLGWSELTGGSAGWTWTCFPDDPAVAEDADDGAELLGLLIIPGDRAEPGSVLVECDDIEVEARVADGYWLAIFVGVDSDAMERVGVLALPAIGR